MQFVTTGIPLDGCEHHALVNGQVDLVFLGRYATHQPTEIVKSQVLFPQLIGRVPLIQPAMR